MLVAAPLLTWGMVTVGDSDDSHHRPEWLKLGGLRHHRYCCVVMGKSIHTAES